MESEKFNEIIELLHNRTRRRILEILSKEEQYPLQISRSLNTSQQAVSKHLKRLEEEGLVVSTTGKSSRGGPPTKIYRLNSEFSLRVDLGPRVFKTEIEDIEPESVEEYDGFREKIQTKDGNDISLEERRELIEQISDEIEELEKKRRYLLKLKEDALSHACRLVRKNFEDYEKRNLLYYVLETGEKDPKKIAKEFEVREDRVEMLIDEIKEKTEIW